MRLSRTLVMGASLVLLAACASPGHRPPQRKNAMTGPKPVLAIEGEDVLVSTAERVSMCGLKTKVDCAIDPGPFPTDPAQSRVYHYEYSFMLVNGTLRIHADGTLTLESGELCISSKLVDDAQGEPRGLLLWLFPLVKSGPVQNGSVSTEYVVRRLDANTVETILRSGPGHAVWIAQSDASGHATAVRLRVGDPGKIGRIDAGGVLQEEAIGQARKDRVTELATWAAQMGVFQPAP